MTIACIAEAHGFPARIRFGIDHGRCLAMSTGPRLLPMFCPQRHINEDSSFCLGFKAGFFIASSDGARAWWRKLEVFLLCQETANATRIWPRALQISHGAAGEIELSAEELATAIGLLEEYREAVRFESGPVARAVKLIRGKTGRLRNGRAACLCGRNNKRGKTKLRRECWKAGDPCLPVIERQRRIAEEEFWRRVARHPCCGTMANCPLQV